MKYPFPSIHMNGRDVGIHNILDGSAVEHDAFETSTFAFIRRWLNDAANFEWQTSGSTGAPKKVFASRDQLTMSAKLTGDALHLAPGDRALICLDTKYIAGTMMLVRALTLGMRIAARTPLSNPLKSLNTPIDFVALVPAQVFEIIHSPQAIKLNDIKTIIIGGGSVSPELITALQPYRCQFYATYGMTETLSHVALQKLNGPQRQSYFSALPGVDLQRDERGCLIIEAPFLAEKIVTNDLIELQNSTTFRWLGRFDNIINTGGIKVIPEKLESYVSMALTSMEIDNKFFIAPLPDEKLGNKIVLVVEGRTFDEVEQEKLGEHLRKYLSRYEIPREVIILNTFEMTETSKINRFRTVQNSDKNIQKFTLKR